MPADKRNGPKGRAGEKRPALPPDVVKKAKEMAAQSGIPLGAAIKVALGTKTLSDTLQAMRAKDEVESLVAGKVLDQKLAGPVLAGKMTIEEALFVHRLRQRKREPDYMNCHFDDFTAPPRPVSIALVGHRIVTGTVAEHRQYEVVVATPEGEKVELRKHDIKFYFPADQRKHVLKTVDWGDKSATVEPEQLRRKASRQDVKARTFLAAVEAGRPVTWETVEGERLKGRVSWFGRWEVVLAFAKGSQVTMMRHAVKSVS